MRVRCACKWCVCAVCACGMYMVSVRGVGFWSVYVVCVFGVCTWCVFLECVRGVYMVSVRGVCLRSVYVVTVCMRSRKKAHVFLCFCI